MNLKKLAEENLRAELGVDEQMEREGWLSLIIFALVFIGIGAGMTVVIVEWII